MQHKKAIVYYDLTIRRDYFEKKESGLPYEMGNLNSLRESVSLVMNNPDLRQGLGKNAFCNYQKNFTKKKRNQQLHAIIVRGGDK